ncbi:MAG: DUF6438 domain-containing protein [Bacteroidota bacterium]|nr:DUF6438 domain-containing protein [Bacteroidota bacterium]
MKLLISSILLLLVAPCNSSKKANATAVTDNSKVIITYKRTPCFGRCPVYSMNINAATKMISYTGEANTTKTGTYTKAISDEELNTLVSAFEKSGFFQMNDEYLGTITDFPSKYISFSDGARSKLIRDRSGAPSELEALEKQLEAIADSEGWKKSEEAGN